MQTANALGMLQSGSQVGEPRRTACIHKNRRRRGLRIQFDECSLRFFGVGRDQREIDIVETLPSNRAVKVGEQFGQIDLRSFAVADVALQKVEYAERQLAQSRFVFGSKCY